MTKPEALGRECHRNVEQWSGIISVEFIGSMAQGYYVPSQSDFEVLVHVHKLLEQSSKQAMPVEKQPSSKRKSRLEAASCRYATLFIDDFFSRMLYHFAMGHELCRLTAAMKRVDHSHRFVWRSHKEGVDNVHVEI